MSESVKRTAIEELKEFAIQSENEVLEAVASLKNAIKEVEALRDTDLGLGLGPILADEVAKAMLNKLKGEGVKQGASEKTKGRPECPERVEETFIALNKMAEELLKNIFKE